jgi:hypothetical protein
MSVVARGNVWVMEQLGEKQDFEAELTRLGFEHEHFELQVERPRESGAEARCDSTYAVEVTNVRTGKKNIYWGGPSENWVVRFATDLARGAFGEPTILRRAYAIPWRIGT